MNRNIAKLFALSAVYLFVLCLGSFAYASDKDDISRYANEYFSLLEAKDYNAGLNYIYPGLFDFVPKDLIVEGMENMEKDSMVKIFFTGFSVSKISDVVIYEGLRYANVDYTFNMVMQVNYENNDSKQLTIDFTLSALKSQFGEDNVVYDEKKSAYLLTPQSNMFAIQDPAYAGWRFLENKENMYGILDQMIPEKIRQDFGFKDSVIDK